MTPSSITIKIDFGAESGGTASAAVTQAGGAPTPLGNAGQILRQADGAPAPSPALAPSGARFAGGGASGGAGDVPTPFSGPGSPGGVSSGSDAVPTPFDSVHGAVSG